jgi:alkylation response protein AidB-like acyl-CoA dehydrogenase
MTTLKGGSFILGDENVKDVFIPEEFTEEQKMIFQMIQDFSMTEVIDKIHERGRELQADKDKEEIVQLLEKAAELGLCGVAISEKHGGMDLDFNTGLIYVDAFAPSGSFTTTIGAQTSIGSLPIVYYGNEAQKDKYLPGVASGALKASYCLTEPNAGSDANSGKTKAILNAEGTHYILNGQKMWITNGGFADLFIVFAKIDDDKDLSAFIVEKAFGGISIGAEEKKLGIKGSSTVQVFFNDCKVPVENLLSERGAGFKIALNILNSGRIKLGAGTTGGSKFAISRTLKFAIERKQFGKSIAEFGAMKHKLGEMVLNTFAMDSAVYRTGRKIDLKTEEFKKAGKEDGEAKLLALREYAIECAILKVKGSENLDFVIDEALQIHGGMGYSVETGIEMGYRDARITRIYEGTNEINRMLSLAEFTKRALQTKEIDLNTVSKEIPMKLVGKLFSFGADSEKEIVDNFKTLFLFLSGVAGKKLGKKLVDEQEIVMNLADIFAEAYVAESVYLRAEKLKTMNTDAKKQEVVNKIVKVYLYDALVKVRKAGEEVIDAYADGFEKTYTKFFLNKLTKPYEINPKDLRRDIADYAIEKQEYPLYW